METGWYSIDLPVNSYRVRASHADYRDYSTGSGLFVIPKQEMYTGNITMWPQTHVGAPYRTKAAPPGPPTVSISVSAPKVAAGQAFSVYLEGTDDNDIS